MKNVFFGKIAGLINGVHEATVDNDEYKGRQYNSGIEKQSDLINAVVSAFKENYAGRQISFKDTVLVIWVNDILFYDSLSSDDFCAQLATTIFEELGFEFVRVEIKVGYEQKDNVLEIMPNVFVQMQRRIDNKDVNRAVIYPVNGNGSMVDECYRIDSQTIQNLPNRRYNIGLGKFPKMSDGSVRENHIAVNDDVNSPEFEKNRYVSRAHAHISYSNEYGFLLCVEYGGTRIAQKRTHIYRGSEKIELNNTLSPLPLEDGDYIVLSKYVRLLFKKA